MNRDDFPILKRTINNHRLVYFDNAATTQKPQTVIDALSCYYAHFNSNIHRGVHGLSQEATALFEEARECVKKFINAPSNQEIIFTRGTTESINLVASSFGKTFINEGDEVLITEMEHHSNIVPWQMICEEKRAHLKVLPFNEKGELCMDLLDGFLTEKTKIVAVTHTSNTLGTINDISVIIEKAHAKNIPVLIDGAQAMSHEKIDVQALDCDFFAFSGHKMYAPMGVGVLYGKEKWLNAMPPYQGGGEMVRHVSFEKTTYNELPYKFEAGTPSVGDVIGLKTAIDYIESIGIEKIADFQQELFQYAFEKLSQIEEIEFFGTAQHKAAIISFNLKGIHPYDVGTILDQYGIAVRTGHHCTQPIMTRFGIPGTVRASFAFYNTFEEIDLLVEAVNKAKKMLQ
ncbi:MAG: cysteine desulfurase [Bacteroidetes bacterium]|nr:cysteine desulfurase [Bacteroidota bacterium]MCL2302399.1 cysteine desulfurase [Lentimicrobiaceae bacterium]